MNFMNRQILGCLWMLYLANPHRSLLLLHEFHCISVFRVYQVWPCNNLCYNHHGIMESLTHLSKGIVYAKSKVLCVVLWTSSGDLSSMSHGKACNLLHKRWTRRWSYKMSGKVGTDKADLTADVRHRVWICKHKFYREGFGLFFGLWKMWEFRERCFA